MAKKSTSKGAHLQANPAWVQVMMSSKGRNLVFADKRTKRNRTRSAQKRSAIREG